MSLADAKGKAAIVREGAEKVLLPDGNDDPRLIVSLKKEMLREAEALNFEKAASIRDRIEEIRMNTSRRRGSGRTQTGDRTKRSGGSG
jgi:excinuclease UvrABC nuclease subunit